MTGVGFHLAQVNIAIAKYAYEDPRFAGFVGNLARIYELAEGTPGFVWRHVTVNDDVEAKSEYGYSNLIFNMSLWESLEALKKFVYQSDHSSILRQRSDWFIPMDGPSFALWWHLAGTIPSIAESKRRIERLAQSGATVDAFTFGHTFDPPQTQQAASG